MFRGFFKRRRIAKALETERELLNQEHRSRLREIEAEHDRKVFELFQSCCTKALEQEPDSREMWTAIHAKLEAAKTKADEIQEESLAAMNAEHKQYMEKLHFLYEKNDYHLTDD